LAPQAGADEAEPVYRTASVNVIELGLSPEAEAALEAEPEEYVEGTFSMSTTDGDPDGARTLLTPTPLKAEIRLKGNSSFLPLSGKAGFKIKFKKTEKFLGLRKMTLNNMFEDTSMLHEALAYTAYRNAGVPASRTSFAYVYVNGEDFGIELNIESVDKEMLGKHFGPFDDATQHLYEGENGPDVVPGDAPEFEVDEGDESNRADLEALIAAANVENGTPWSSRVAPYADLGELTKMWAIEKYVGHWDGYAGEGTPNNYYLYSGPTGVFQMIPWGSDEGFEDEHHLAFDGEAGVLFNFCLEDPVCAEAYLQAVGSAKTSIDRLDLDGLAQKIAALLGPWQEAEQLNDRHEHDLEGIAERVAETRRFLAARPAEASEWLAAHDPSPPAPPSPAPILSPAPTDTEPPQTAITHRPKSTTLDRSPTFRFKSSESESRFECAIDSKPFRPCDSPKTYRKLSYGSHLFRVKAVDPATNADPSAANARFKVSRPQRPR
jgi:hypothetical protein